MKDIQNKRVDLPHFMDAVLESINLASIANFGKKTPLVLLLLGDDEDQQMMGSNACPYRVAAALDEAHQAMLDKPEMYAARAECDQCPYDDDLNMTAGKDRGEYLH